MAAIDARIKSTVEQIISWFVDGDYLEIERYTYNVRLSAALMCKAIEDYGRTLVMPPKSSFDELDIIEITDSRPRAWSLRFDLWTVEEGRSDLTLECTLIDGNGPMLEVEVDNVHVM